MHEYSFKIKKGSLEFEFSTTDKEAFEQQLSDWIQGVMNSQSPIVESPLDETPDKPQRKGFIEVKDLVKINDLQVPPLREEHEIISENFENILEEAIENPKIEVIEKTETLTPFQVYLSAFLPQSPVDFLILSAKFIADNENIHNFAIKQINAKLVPSGHNPIDHGVINEALEKNLVAVVPNCTDINDVREYTLTEEGENYAVPE